MPSEPEHLVQLEDEATLAEIAAIEAILADAGMEAPVRAGMIRHSAGDLPWHLLWVTALAYFVKPFAEGAMTRVGERTADAGWEKLADIAKRMRAARTGANGRFEIEDAPSKAQFHITADLPDEAFKALTEIDLSIPGNAGNVFVWDHEAGHWRPVL
ncbi:hypothetical protein ACIBM8_31205 [Micromonospora aurantiaca]|uniref:hypothetical protein n=1 Tax=Micromonospora TaxID=1873 RepID=UPI0021CA8405|nr:hypothetical protein [Micromonospora sp. Mcm103]